MVETPNEKSPKESRIISTVLSPALRLWLRSQVEQVETLQFKIWGSDRQILTGYIPRVSIAAIHAIYQGLHLSQIELEGHNIRVNLGQVIKGKPLRLLEPVPLTGQLLLQETDLQASLSASLLSTALTELLITFLTSNGIPNPVDNLNQQVNWQQIVLDTGQLTLFGILTNTPATTTSVVIRAGLQLVKPNTLQLNPLQINLSPNTEPLTLNNVQIDLGSDVEIQELTLTSGQLMCCGRLKVIP